MLNVELDDQEITATLRGFIAELRSLDDQRRKLDRDRRDLYQRAQALGFNVGAIKAIALEKNPEEAQSEANDLLGYVRLSGGDEAAAEYRKAARFSALFGCTDFPSDFADNSFKLARHRQQVGGH
jgi:uncharacterized protein (UPF0335 family)